MKKREYIKRYGKSAYSNRLAKVNEWNKQHPIEVKAGHNARQRRNGKFYAKKLVYDRTGLRGERNIVRMRHQRKWRSYKRIVAPDSQLHHSWRPGSADYDGVALVEVDAHRHGIIDVIKILEGKITLFTEQAIRER
jgi:hypothetical protein